LVQQARGDQAPHSRQAHGFRERGSGAGRVDPLPNQIMLKNVLQRLVQLLKRHRDITFEKTHERAPISIILTTLAAKSYAEAALGNEYESEFDLLRDVIAGCQNTSGRA